VRVDGRMEAALFLVAELALVLRLARGASDGGFAMRLFLGSLGEGGITITLSRGMVSDQTGRNPIRPLGRGKASFFFFGQKEALEGTGSLSVCSTYRGSVERKGLLYTRGKSCGGFLIKEKGSSFPR